MRLSWHARGAVTAERMRSLIRSRGFTPNGHPLWEQPETGRLVGKHPDYPAVFVEPWRRTKPATYSKAQRLKITRPRGRPWSDNEILRLRKIYPRGTRDEILAAFPGRTYPAITKAANARAIYRVPRVLKPTGSRVLDLILERARKRNVSMKELDQVTRRSGYFARRKWCSGRYDHRAHFRAVLFLGGSLRAEWKCCPNPELLNGGRRA